ncbi:hypothetical protein [Pseudoalteromonas luteoviolacea]|uniref:Uncharacterized protein n=1 Tax=Pseudoalteromonas luteoviolacea NCIMB 1942 TaxID=1365253 RepID=A0A166ZHS9_9GAMM|nr:hypothetical protein [Pseudoalteromonas luteoviolacea]KZN44330.1 hypothetical protein N482_16945 [Pseudoalteromonas luteoviolacea NCIMB 1942]
MKKANELEQLSKVELIESALLDEVSGGTPHDDGCRPCRTCDDQPCAQPCVSCRSK